MKTLTCVCLPDKEASRKVVRLRNEISEKCGSEEALAYPPHFTIRGDFKIEDHHLPNLISDLRRELAVLPSINIELVNYGFYPWKIIYLDIEKTPQLQDLHNICMHVIERYRHPWIPDKYGDASNFAGKQLEYVKKYGYHFCFEFFSPHFTLAGNDMNEEIFQRMKKQLEKKKENIKVQVEYLAFIDRENANKILKRVTLV